MNRKSLGSKILAVSFALLFLIFVFGMGYLFGTLFSGGSSNSGQTVPADLNTLNSVKSLLSQLQDEFHTDTLTTCSDCFGDRCIGCWKLYYDTVFTEG